MDMIIRIPRWFPRIGTVLAPLMTVVLFGLTASPGFAIGPGSGPPGGEGGNPPTLPPENPPGTDSGPPPSTQPVPEINAGSAVAALVLLVGGTLILTDRTRRRAATAAHDIR